MKKYFAEELKMPKNKFQKLTIKFQLRYLQNKTLQYIFNISIKIQVITCDDLDL